MLLKLRYDGSLSNFAFNVNLRRYTQVMKEKNMFAFFDMAYQVGRCWLTLGSPQVDPGMAVLGVSA